MSTLRRLHARKHTILTIFFDWKRISMNLIKHTLAAAVLLTTAAAWAQNVAIVNGKPVPSSRVEALEKQVASQGRPVTPDMKGQIKEEVINREVFMQEAQKRGIDGSDEYKTQIEQARELIMIRSLFSDYQKKNPVTDAEAKAEYDKFAAANGGKEYKARHILVEQEALANKLTADIKKGAKFEDLAKKNSKDPGSGANGGDLDWANPSNYVPEFAQALVALEKGKLTDKPVKSQFGWHIIRLDDVRQAQLPPFEQVKPQITQQLTQQKLANFQRELREKAKVE
jgi:peptidyl-prolyl cis-trans isomerase C